MSKSKIIVGKEGFGKGTSNSGNLISNNGSSGKEATENGFKNKDNEMS